MTPEEKAKERYPYNPLDGVYMKWFLKGGRNGFIEGANWMEGEKDREIAALKADLPLNFWVRLKDFVHNVETGCCMGEEEKYMIMEVCAKHIGNQFK